MSKREKGGKKGRGSDRDREREGKIENKRERDLYKEAGKESVCKRKN